MSDFLSIVSDGIKEGRKAAVRFPQPNYTISKFAEESGEVVKAAIHCAEGRYYYKDLRSEMVQVIAMLWRMESEGDQVHGLLPLEDGLNIEGSQQ